MKYKELTEKVFDFSVSSNKILTGLNETTAHKHLVSKITEKAIEIWELFSNLVKTQEIDLQVYKINSILNKLDLYLSDLKLLIASISNSEIQGSLMDLIRKAEDLNLNFSKILEEINQKKALEEKRQREKRFPYLGYFSFITFVISLILFINTDADFLLFLIVISIIGLLLQIMKTLSS